MGKQGQKLHEIYLRGLEAEVDFIAYMRDARKVTPQELGRGLFAAAADFYRQHGWFTFPVVIQPEAFQARCVAEEQALYEAGLKEIKGRKKP